MFSVRGSGCGWKMAGPIRSRSAFWHPSKTNRIESSERNRTPSICLNSNYFLHAQILSPKSCDSHRKHVFTRITTNLRTFRLRRLAPKPRRPTSITSVLNRSGFTLVDALAKKCPLLWTFEDEQGGWKGQKVLCFCVSRRAVRNFVCQFCQCRSYALVCMV